MEDIFKFLLIAGIMIISFVRQAKKEAKKKAGNTPAVPVPDEGRPFPETLNDEIYGGYIPESPKPVTVVARKKTEKKHKPAPKQPFIQPNTDNTLSEPADVPSEFEIHSAEEARKAIIWGEILQRKY
ncbi:hypothetical protein [uncultured Bacteroides sp.]|uniref:hypothetical protein n=1 Tax=uncultured Bacteroides sp. TaxID=162156 RepID=UPI0025D8E567|nr:hypothetical protein [uncultured Bacteroides sp.]